MRQTAALLVSFVAIASAALTSDEERDIFDRPITPLVAGRPRLVLFANRDTRDGTSDPANQLSVRLHQVPYVTVVRVDLRGIPSLFEGVARTKIQRAHDESIQRSRTLYESQGITPPIDLPSRLLFIGDSNGDSHRAQGLKKGFSPALAIVEDAEGREVVRGLFPDELDKIEAALTKLAP